MGHVFHSVLAPELEYEGQNNNFSKYLHLCQNFDTSVACFWKLILLSSNSSSGAKTEWKTCSKCLIFTKMTNSDPMSANVSWFLLDWKNTLICIKLANSIPMSAYVNLFLLDSENMFYYEKILIWSHRQNSYINFIAYLDFQKDWVFI